MAEFRPDIRTTLAHPDGGFTLRFFLAADMPLFVGHFPGAPILPGVVQIHWAIRLAADHYAIAGGFSRLLNIKFQKPIRPDSEVELTLSYDRAQRQLSFAYATTEGLHASGRIEFAATGQP